MNSHAETQFPLLIARVSRVATELAFDIDAMENACSLLIESFESRFKCRLTPRESEMIITLPFVIAHEIRHAATGQIWDVDYFDM